jgi:SET domain-containing protein
MKNPKTKIYRTKKEILQFFKSQGLVYLERTRIDWKPLLCKKLNKSSYYKTNEAEFKKLCRQYGQLIECCHKAPLYIKKINATIGYGVFAAKNIYKDDFIGEYAGVVQIADKLSDCEEDIPGYETDYTWYYLDKIKDGPALEINGRLEGNEMRFINHSPDSNVDVDHTLYKGQWVIFFRAARDIEKDEQLLINYGEQYWEDDCRKMKSI